MPIVAGEVRNGKVISATTLQEIGKLPYSFALEQFLIILFGFIILLLIVELLSILGYVVHYYDNVTYDSIYYLKEGIFTFTVVISSSVFVFAVIFYIFNVRDFYRSWERAQLIKLGVPVY